MISRMLSPLVGNIYLYSMQYGIDRDHYLSQAQFAKREATLAFFQEGRFKMSRIFYLELLLLYITIMPGMVLVTD